MKRYVKKCISQVTAKVLLKAGAFMMFLSVIAVNFCAVPYWYNEPELPQCMLDEL